MYETSSTASISAESIRNSGSNTIPNSSSSHYESGNSTSEVTRDDRRLGAARQSQFHQHLLRSLDLLACHYLLLVYLHDTSTYRLLLRGLAQTVFLSPRIARIRLPAVFNSRPILVILLGFNVYCVVAHAFFSSSHATASSSSAAEVMTTGPLLHGGLTTEFIGDRPFRTATPFIVFDFAILIVQIGLFCLMFFPKMTKPVLSAESSIINNNTSSSNSSSSVNSGSAAPAPEEEHIVDADEVVPDVYDYYAGTYTLADLRLMDTLRWAWSAHLQETPGSSAADVEAGLGSGPHAVPSATSTTTTSETGSAIDANRSLSLPETISRFLRSLT